MKTDNKESITSLFYQLTTFLPAHGRRSKIMSSLVILQTLSNSAIKEMPFDKPNTCKNMQEGMDITEWAPPHI